MNGKNVEFGRDAVLSMFRTLLELHSCFDTTVEWTFARLASIQLSDAVPD